MQKRGTLDLDEKTVIAEDYKTDVQNAPLKTHFQAIVDNATLDCEGERNIFHAPKFIAGLVNHLLPHATLWSSMMLGDLGRHGTGPAYQQLSKLYSDIQQSKNQSFRVEMEKWKDKRIKRKGVYVSPLVTELPLKKKKTERLL
ncbi:inositol 1,4,5-triphosphate receptor-associated cGMP kinase substrate [Sarotherodon galilaeus]